jgi:Ala-tRNA(Pro) deacylase
MNSTASVFERLNGYLLANGIAFQVSRHEAVFTSEEAARVRGTSLSSGAKALICKVDDAFVMFVLPADRRLAGKLVRRNAGIRNLRFASRDEVLDLTGLTPGSIPPFGKLFGLETWCDERLSQEPCINFNAGDHSISISMSYTEYERVEKPRLGQFTE